MKAKSERAGGVVDLRSAPGIMLHQLGLTICSATASPECLLPPTPQSNEWLSLWRFKTDKIRGFMYRLWLSNTGGIFQDDWDMLGLRLGLCLDCLRNGSKARLIWTFTWLESNQCLILESTPFSQRKSKVWRKAVSKLMLSLGSVRALICAVFCSVLVCVCALWRASFVDRMKITPMQQSFSSKWLSLNWLQKY